MSVGFTIVRNYGLTDRIKPEYRLNWRQFAYCCTLYLLTEINFAYQILKVKQKSRVFV